MARGFPLSDDVRLSTLERSQPVILMLMILFGLIAGTAFGFDGELSNQIIYGSLIGLMFGIALGTPLSNVLRSFTNIRFFAIAWAMNFIIVPLIGFVLASLFLRGNDLIFVGFILYVVAPCTDWFLVFTSMARGDVPLGLALLPTNLVLQILLIPLYLWLFAGEVVPFQLSALLESVVVFILLPFAVAAVFNHAVVRAKGLEWKEKKMAQVPLALQTLTLAIVIFLMFASQTQVIIDNAGPLLVTLVPILIFFLCSFLIVQAISRAIRLKYEEYALLSCTSIARNSPLVLAIAFGLFPDQPLIQVAIIIGVLIELPVLVLLARMLLKSRKSYEERRTGTTSPPST